MGLCTAIAIFPTFLIVATCSLSSFAPALLRHTVDLSSKAVARGTFVDQPSGPRCDRMSLVLAPLIWVHALLTATT